jgi:hypothetical protein
MKKALVLALVLVLALTLTACGSGSSNSGGSTTTPPADNNTSAQADNSGSQTTEQKPSGGEWPDNEWTALVPKPTVGTIDPFGSGASGDNSRCIIDMGWTADEAKAYAAEVKAAGFDTEESVTEEADYYEYFAKHREERYYVSVEYTKIPAGDYGYITITNYNFHE